MSKLLLCILAGIIFTNAATASPQASAQCSALIRKAGANLKIIRFGDLIGDGAREYIAAELLPQQPNKGIYVSRLLIARAEHGRCSVVFTAGKNGPRNTVGYVGIEFIDDGGSFYGYEFEFVSDRRDPPPEPNYKGAFDLTWLNPEHEPEGMGIEIGWNEKVGRYQEFQLEDESSSEMFKPELPNPKHINSKLCKSCPK